MKLYDIYSNIVRVNLLHNTIHNMNKCEVCQKRYKVREGVEHVCEFAKQAEVRAKQDFMTELKKLQDKVSRMEVEITRLKTIVHKNPKRKDIINTLNARNNFPYMRIFDKWCKEFPQPSMEEVETWFSVDDNTMSLESKFVEYIVTIWWKSQNEHPPLYCNSEQKNPTYYVYDVEDVCRSWRIMTPKDWSFLVHTIYNTKVYSVCYAWFWSKDASLPVQLSDKYAKQINQLLKHENKVIMELKRAMTERCLN